jgi:uncharacterized protein (DUF2237 family)
MSDDLNVFDAALETCGTDPLTGRTSIAITPPTEEEPKP